MRKGTKFIGIFGALVMLPALAACGGSADAQGTSYQVPKSLVGNWYQTENGIDGIIMSASVNRNNTIQINMETRDSGGGIYWMGSFDSGNSPKTSFTTVSLADPDAMKWEIFSSQDQTKSFTYKNGDLSYKFSMMGTTTTVHLRKPSTKATPTRTATKPSINKPASKPPTFKAPAPVKTRKK
jgi:hypothetical protein